MNIVTYTEARAAGAPTYFTGVPCPRGHISPRRSGNADCVACVRERCRLWVEKNRERKRAYDAAYVRSAEGAERDRECSRLNAAKVRRDSPETKRAYQSTRRARKKGSDGSHSAAEIKALYAIQKGKCGYCKVALKKRYHADHIMPLALGGHNRISNMQILCQPFNQRKKNKHPIQFAQQIGLLL